jgi:hypothetical protein
VNTAVFTLLVASASELAVFPVVKTEAGDISADAVHAHVEAIATRRAGIEVVSRSQFLTTPRETIRALGDCAIEAACLARVARAFTARYLVVVIANTTVDPPLVGTLLIDVDEQKLVHRSLGDGELPPLRRVDKQVDDALDAAGFERLARLTVRAEPEDADIQVTTAARRDADGTFWVAPGDVTLDVRREGFEPEQRTLVAAPGGDQSVEIQLSRDASVLTSPWLWIGVGVAVAAGVGAAVFVSRQDPAECACVGPADCPPGC